MKETFQTKAKDIINRYKEYNACIELTALNTEDRASRTAEVGMGETVNPVLVVVVSGAGVPGYHFFRIGTQLDQSLGYRRSGEGAAAQGASLVGLGADEGIDVFGIVAGPQHKTAQ